MAEQPPRAMLVEARASAWGSTDMLGIVGAFHPWPRFGAGVGVGIDPWAKPQLAVMLRARPLMRVKRSRLHAMLVELAFSQGQFRHVFANEGCEESEGAPCPRLLVSDSARFAQLDLAWETESPRGFVVHMAVGVALLLNPTSRYCETAAPCAEGPRMTPSFTLGLGHGF